MSGYSKTPLTKKLGLTEEVKACLLHPPAQAEKLLAEYYAAMRTSLRGNFDWVLAFYTQKALLKHEFPTLLAHLIKTGQLWIAWPKQSSGRETDLNENLVREIGLAKGVVDTKVVAIDEAWSGLKFVYRLPDR
jgi:hypothetical protein